MIKRLFLLFAFLLYSLMSTAQDFEIVSVEHLPNDFAAREEMKTDHNDRQCALLRIATQKITPEQREGFTFKPDLGSEQVERATRNGEIWLWVSPGLKYLRIMHRDWGQCEHRMLDHVSRVESLHTYKIVIKGPEFGPGPQDNTPRQQYLAFQITPPNAFLEVDGKPVKVNPDGSASKYVDFGVHTYSVRATDYFPKESIVTVDDPDNTVVVKLALDPDFAEVTLKVDADAEIWVNNERKGIRTWTGVLGSDLYKIECKQANHETSEISLEISADMAGRTFTLPVPNPIYGSLNVESTPDFATIYIDGEEVGKTPKSIREILIGQHEIRLTKDGYADHTETITITKGERKQVTATLNVDGSASVAKKPQWPEITITPKPEIKQSSAAKSSSSVFFVVANAAYSVAPQFSFGLTVGSVKRWGWYVSFGTNFNFDNSNGSFTCDGDGNWISQFVGDYGFTGASKTSRVAATAGVAFKMRDPLYVYAGGGYGYRNLYWYYTGTGSGTYAKNVDCSYQGFALDAGLMLHFNGFGVSLGVQTIGVKYMEAKIGIGYTLIRK